MRIVSVLLILLLVAAACRAVAAEPTPSQRARLLYAGEAAFQQTLQALDTFISTNQHVPTTQDCAAIMSNIVTFASNSFADLTLMTMVVTNLASYLTNDYQNGSYRIAPITVQIAVALTTDTNLSAAVNRSVHARYLSLFDYSMFVDGPLYLVVDKEMRVSGAVHANGILTLGGPLPQYGMGLSICGFTTCASNIYCIANPDRVYLTNVGSAFSAGGMASMNWYGMVLDCSNANWRELSDQVWNGGVRSAVHGVKPLCPIPCISNNPHALIDLPDSNDSPAIAAVKFSNRAGVRVLTNGVIQRYVGGATPYQDTGARAGSVTWLTTNQYFWNPVVSNWVRPWDVDVALFKTWAAANAAYGFVSNQATAGILYIAAPTNKSYHAVRLKNGGTAIPNPVFPGGVSNGFVVVTHNPLYIWGYYNRYAAFHVDSDAHALCAGDSITVLSDGWTDGHTPSMTLPLADNTEYWTSILTGLCTNRYLSESVDRVGCIDSLPRHIENWPGVGMGGNKSIHGTIAALWMAKYNAFEVTSVTNSPSRYWVFDSKFASPAAPILFKFDINIPNWRHTESRQ